MPAITSTTLRPNYRGTWASGQAYRVNDVVYYNSASYVAITASTAKTPSSEPTYWGVLTQSVSALAANQQITWGTDPLTNFYRYAQSMVRTDGQLGVGLNLYVNHGLVSQSALGAVGPGGQMGVQLYDTKIYRDDVNRLRTDNDFSVAGDLKLVKGGVYGNDGESQNAASLGYIKSRSGGLVTNGNGGLLNNYNFSSFTFDSGDTHGGGGSFLANVAQTGLFSDERIPVDPGDGYTLSFWAKSGDTNPTTGAITNYNANNIQYAGFAPYDADGLIMEAIHRVKVFGSANTTLSAALNPGDTTVKLTDATGWNSGSDSGPRHFNWWPYTGSNGTKYPVYGYTRNTSLYIGVANAYTNGTWAQNGISGNTITLTAPWTGPTLASGTPVQNAQTGGTYLYTALAATAIPSTWTRYSAQLLGSNSTKLPDVDSYMLPVGCASVRLVFLVNYHGSADNKVRYSGIDMVETSGDGGRVAKITADTYLPLSTSFGTGDARTFLVDATSGTRTVTIGSPAKLGLGPLRWTFAKSDASANPVVINAAGGGSLIDGGNSVSLTRTGETRTIVHDGTNWISVSAYRPAAIDTVTAGSNTTTQGIFAANSAAGTSGLFLKDGGNDRWAVYMTGANSPLYVRDTVNARMQAVFNPGASSTSSSTTFNSNVVVNGTAQLNGDLAVVGGSQFNSINATNGVLAGSPTNGAGILTVDSNNGTVGMFFRDGGATKWGLATLGTNQPMLLIDSVNNRGQVQFTPGASNTTATTTFSSNVVVQGNESVVGTLAVTGGITGVNSTNGAPAGGTTGQVLAKKSATNYDTQWVSSGFTPVAKSGAYQAAAGEYVFVDASGGAVNISAPISPANGALFGIRKTEISSNAVSISGGLFVQEMASPNTATIVYLNRMNEGVEFIYDSAGAVWRQRTGTGTLDQAYLPRYVVGRWYDRRSFSTVAASALSSVFTPAASTIYYVPIFSGARVQFDRLGYLVGTTAPTAGASVRFGLYSNVGGLPTALLQDFGISSLGSAAATSLKFTYTGGANVIPKGWSWIAMSFNGTSAGTTPTIPLSSMPPSPSVGIAEADFSYYPYATGGLSPTLYSANGDSAAAALASTATNVTALYGGQMPNPFFRVLSVA